MESDTQGVALGWLPAALSAPGKTGLLRNLLDLGFRFHAILEFMKCAGVRMEGLSILQENIINLEL
jgi:hypothetical protein